MDRPDHVETFNEYRNLLFSIAYRMLGSAMDAEDMVQESYLNWGRVTTRQVESPKSYLTAIVTRLCIDHLRSAKVRREEYMGPWLPEPILTDHSPDTVALAESLSLAFLVVLETLSPIERAVFLLREVFEYDYDEIARIVDKSEVNCRQMVKRAKEHITTRRPRFETSVEQQRAMLMKFGEVCMTGNMEGLLALLADDIVEYSDGGGKVSAAIHPVKGATNVARLFISLVTKKLPPNHSAQMLMVNGQPAAVNYSGDQPYSVILLDSVDGRIQTIYNILNPEKLKCIPPLH